MRLLLDECVPKRLKHELLGHDLKTVQEMGWAGVKNGALVTLATILPMAVRGFYRVCDMPVLRSRVRRRRCR